MKLKTFMREVFKNKLLRDKDNIYVNWNAGDKEITNIYITIYDEQAVEFTITGNIGKIENCGITEYENTKEVEIDFQKFTECVEKILNKKSIKVNMYDDSIFTKGNIYIMLDYRYALVKKEDDVYEVLDMSDEKTRNFVMAEVMKHMGDKGD